MTIRLARRVLGRAGKRHFLRLVSEAYQDPGGPAHARIRRGARRWFGIDHAGALAAAWSDLFIDCVFQAQRALHRQGIDRDLGRAPIGFENLTLHCRTSDANSSVVYLYGFSDNLPYFPLYRALLRPGSAAVDIGANLGIHSLVLARCVGVNGRVLAYEPAPAIHDRLLGNIRDNAIPNIVPRALGLWERSGRAGFEPRAADFNIGKGAIRDSAAQQVPVTTLDEEDAGIGGRRIDLIKIDVEGGELSVLRGARRTLAEHRPAVIVEFNPDRYSLRELIDAIPFAVRLHRVPYTLRENLAPIAGPGYERRADLLLVPGDRRLPDLMPI